MRYMIIETFEPENLNSVYERVRDEGRLMPDGLSYVESWVTDDLRRCFQIVDCDDESLIDEWIYNWDDLVEFEVIPIMSSSEASSRVLNDT